MRRTHILHDRDNRRARPSHFNGSAPRDPRVLAWLRDGNRQTMTLNGVSLATVEPHGAEYYDPMLGEIARVHTAHIHGENFNASPTFPNCDAARLHCEAAFSAS